MSPRATLTNSHNLFSTFKGTVVASAQSYELHLLLVGRNIIICSYQLQPAFTVIQPSGSVCLQLQPLVHLIHPQSNLMHESRSVIADEAKFEKKKKILRAAEGLSPQGEQAANPFKETRSDTQAPVWASPTECTQCKSRLPWHGMAWHGIGMPQIRPKRGEIEEEHAVWTGISGSALTSGLFLLEKREGPSPSLLLLHTKSQRGSTTTAAATPLAARDRQGGFRDTRVDRTLRKKEKTF